jgi:hypothetical protein
MQARIGFLHSCQTSVCHNHYGCWCLVPRAPWRMSCPTTPAPSWEFRQPCWILREHSVGYSIVLHALCLTVQVGKVLDQFQANAANFATATAKLRASPASAPTLSRAHSFDHPFATVCLLLAVLMTRSWPCTNHFT